MSSTAAGVLIGSGAQHLTDAQWALVDPLLSDEIPGGRIRVHPKRELVNAVLYVVRAGCAWRQLPKDFPPWETVYWWFARWRDDGSLDALHDELRIEVRKKAGRNEAPRAGCLDAQSVKGADTVPASTRGYDAGKKTGGRKRHIIVDTMGLLLVVMVTSASVQDRDGALGPLATLEPLRGARCSGLLALWRDPDLSRQPMARALCRSLPRKTRLRLAVPSSDPWIVIDGQRVERAGRGVGADPGLTLRQPGRIRG